MKFPDALRVLCEEIVRKHIPGEVELYEMAGTELIESADQSVVLLPQEGGDAEFGSTRDSDVEFVSLWRSLVHTASNVRGQDPEAIRAFWIKSMTQHGLAADLASSIAQDFAASLAELA